MDCSCATSSEVLSTEATLFGILDYCDETTRNTCVTLSRSIRDLLTSDSSFKWRLHRLHIEYGVYFSSEKTGNVTWKSLYQKNLTKKTLWQRSLTSSKSRDVQKKCSEDFHINVAARFKPRTHDDSVDHAKKIALPLHQRLALIRVNRKLKSNKEAFQVLKEQGGWFGAEMRERFIPIDDDDSNNSEEKKREEEFAPPSLSGGVQHIDIVRNSVVLVDRIQGLRKFEFDSVLNDSHDQKEVYLRTAMPLVTEFINGFNATCLVYGQTGSGKTHTMFGSPDLVFQRNEGNTSWGIIPRACAEIFDALEYRRSNLNIDISSHVTVSYIEVYGNNVHNLLRNGELCGQNKVSNIRYVLDGSAEVPVSSLENTMNVLNEGEKQKRKAATAMNERSSRAHSLVIMTLHQECQSTGVSSQSRLFLADLGGSEQLKSSQPRKNFNANDEESKKEMSKRLQEAVFINLGLLALKQVVEALRKKARNPPYSDSKLTMMLSSGLGGDSKTSVIVCGAQEQRHTEMTIAAMKFGQSCRGISNVVTNKVNLVKELLNNINQQIDECESNIKKYERWQTEKVHTYAPNGDVLEVKQRTTLVGAEQYRSQLASLLKQKMELTGDDDKDKTYATDSTKVRGFGNAHAVAGLGSGVGVSTDKNTNDCAQS